MLGWNEYPPEDWGRISAFNRWIRYARTRFEVRFRLLTSGNVLGYFENTWGVGHIMFYPRKDEARILGSQRIYRGIREYEEAIEHLATFPWWKGSGGRDTRGHARNGGGQRGDGPSPRKKILNLERDFDQVAPGAVESGADSRGNYIVKTIKSLTELDATRDYLNRVHAEPRSLKTAVITEKTGRYWKDRVVIGFDKDGNVRAPDAYMPTELEQQAINREWMTVEWPVIKPVFKVIDPPAMIRDAEPGAVFEFRDGEGRIVFIQVRVEIENAAGEKDKKYVPWTYWSDDEWRSCEPDGPLPLYNAHLLKDAQTVFIHEGAKAARAVQTMVDGETAEEREKLAAHPWGKELANAVHVGWIGGALSPLRTDWTQIRKLGAKRAYIVSDNDEPGIEAVPPISKALNIPAFQVQFTEEFPASFDLADPFPDNMFGKVNGVKVYTGRGFREYLHPATWATDLVPPPAGTKGRPRAVLRDSFRGMWSYIEEADMFVCNDMPDIMRSESVLNKMLAPFSHVAETTKLLLKSYQGRTARVCYRPDQPGLTVTSRGSSAINLHVPPSIRPLAGDPTPFLDFLNYMFPNDRERYEVMRWCATIIARPDIRMTYGLLLISEKQGIGKTTLGSLILAPLVGETNVGYPSESDILSPFNDWVAHKRLAIVNEIYSGASWKAYHSLKSVITDRDVTVNQKYMRPYVIENWCHVIACSNSMRALKMENDDRRWFYPEVTEFAWPRAKFVEFRGWVESGGLAIILHWAKEWTDYVEPSDRAPMTGRKKEMIDGSRSEAQKEAVAIAEAVVPLAEPVGLLIKDVVEWVRAQAQGRVFDTDYEIRKAMGDVGMITYDKRIKVGGRLQYAIMNPALADLVRAAESETEINAIIREKVRKVADYMEGSAM